MKIPAPAHPFGMTRPRAISHAKLAAACRNAKGAMVNDYLPAGKNLPGHNRLAALSAAPRAAVFSVKPLINRIS
jgi:hypothetical protein